MEIAGFFLISGRKWSVILSFTNSFFHQMPFFAGVPICISKVFCVRTAGNDHNSTPFFYPMNEFGTVVSSISQNQFSAQIKKVLAVPVPYRCHFDSHRKAKNAMDSQAHPSPHGLLWSDLPGCARFFRPFFPTTGTLVYPDACTVQHQRCFLHQIFHNKGR